MAGTDGGCVWCRARMAGKAQVQGCKWHGASGRRCEWHGVHAAGNASGREVCKWQEVQVAGSADDGKCRWQEVHMAGSASGREEQAARR